MIIGWIAIWNDTNKITTVDVDVSGCETLCDQLEHIFRCCNVVDGSDIEVVPHQHPSMTAGDIVFIDNDEGTNEAYWCGPIGWFKVTDRQALQEYLDMPRRDRHFHAPYYATGLFKDLIRNTKAAEKMQRV